MPPTPDSVSSILYKGYITEGASCKRRGPQHLLSREIRLVVTRSIEAAAHPVERLELYVSHCIVRDPRSSQYAQH